MYRKILVATDLTEASSPALAAGIDLARRLGSSVIALHVTPPAYEPRFWFTPLSATDRDYFTSLAKKEQEAARRVLEEQIAKLKGDSPILSEALVSIGYPADVIRAVAIEREADLVVVGTHGRVGMQHLLLGSVAERVLRTAPCAVLAVRGGK